jgi:hypothetical protein
LIVTINAKIPALFGVLKQRKDEMESILKAYCEENNIVKKNNKVLLLLKSV